MPLWQMQGQQAGVAEQWPSVHSVPLGLAQCHVDGNIYPDGRGAGFKMKTYDFEPLQHFRLPPGAFRWRKGGTERWQQLMWLVPELH